MNSAFIGYEELSRSRRVLSTSAFGLDLLNSSYPTQPHLLIGKYTLRYVHVKKKKCIPNWPLPIGAFQDQCKQIVINKHIKVKNPNWREADQLAIYKRRREVELGATKNNIS